MSKNKPTPSSPSTQNVPPRAAKPKSAPTGRPALAIRLIASVLVSWHVFAVFMAPMSLPPTSPLITQLVMGSPDRVSPMQWYLDILYINHGYHFFAPDPGPGHLINYVVTDERGATIADGTFPDVNEYWPRLRYHRHFMLTDQAELPMRNHDPQTAQQMTLDAYARHLLREYDGSQAEVTRVRHYMLSPREKNDNIAIDDPRKYETVMQRIQRASDLNQPPATTAAAPNPEFGAWRDTGQMRRMR